MVTIYALGVSIGLGKKWKKNYRKQGGSGITKTEVEDTDNDACNNNSLFTYTGPRATDGLCLVLDAKKVATQLHIC